jgi:hypothetical protein
MNRPLLAILSILIAAPAFAGEPANADLAKIYLDASAGMAAARAQAAKAAPSAPAQQQGYKSQAVIEKVLTEMNDGNEIGAIVVDQVRVSKLKIELDASLPDAPRVLAPLIAKAAAVDFLKIAPACSEAEYIRVSLEVRTWLELGGDKKTLPVIDPISGYKDQAMSDEFKLWLDNGSEMALYKLGQKAGTKDLMELADAEKDPSKKRFLDEANKFFVQFLLTENNWKQSNAFRLK